MRVLHLIDPGSPGGGACTLQLLAEPVTRLNTVDQDVLLIGHERHEQLARECGVEPTGRLTAPHNEPALAGFAGSALKHYIRESEEARGQYDIIHTWTARSTLLAAMAAPQRKRVATLSVGPVNSFVMQLLGAVLEYRPCPLLATSRSVRRDFIAMGLDDELIDVLPPAVHPEAVELEDRAALRARWGVEKNSFVIGLLAEPVNWCDAKSAVRILALAAESKRDVRLVLHPKASRRTDAQIWAEKIGLDDRIILEDDVAVPWKVVNGLDAALLLGDDTSTFDLRHAGSPFSLLFGGGRALRPMPGVMPALWAMAAGVPVVAESSAAAHEFIEDGVTGLLVPQHDQNRAADRLVRLYDDRTIGGRIGAAARQQIHDRYHVSAYCVRLKDVYERILEGREARIAHDDSGNPVVESRREVVRRKEEAAAAKAAR